MNRQRRNIWALKRYHLLTCASISTFHALKGTCKVMKEWHSPITPQRHNPYAHRFPDSFLMLSKRSEQCHRELTQRFWVTVCKLQYQNNQGQAIRGILCTPPTIYSLTLTNMKRKHVQRRIDVRNSWPVKFITKMHTDFPQNREHTQINCAQEYKVKNSSGVNGKNFLH